MDRTEKVVLGLVVVLVVSAQVQAQEATPLAGPSRTHLWILRGTGEVITVPTPGVEPTAAVTPTPTPLPQEITILLPGDVPMELVRIDFAKDFWVGSAPDPGWNDYYEDPDTGEPYDGEPLHWIDVRSPWTIYMGKYEVTQEQWRAVKGTNPSSGYGVGPDYPVYDVSLGNSQAFSIALTNLGLGEFRLPGDHEWEYACRAGTTTRFSFGDSTCWPTGTGACDLDDYAWWAGNSGAQAHPVGQKLPNAWGLYDMHGNIKEWCGNNPAAGSIRGGSFFRAARSCPSPARDTRRTPSHSSETGFRVVMYPPE